MHKLCLNLNYVNGIGVTPCAGTIKERETQLKFDHSITLHQCKLYLHKVSTHKYVHIRCGIDHGSVVAHASFKVSFKGYVHIAYVKQLHVICVGYNLFACAHIYIQIKYMLCIVYIVM